MERIVYYNMCSKYNNVISLGFFCSVASEIEKIGLRSSSYPFDWLISDFKGVIAVIENHFEDFMSYENMAQHELYPSFYKDTKYGMQFYHDFDEYHSLKKQMPSVYKKYKRRIHRFYQSIKKPSLFLRYIESQDELEWIERNYDRIISLLKSFNDNNSIIWIANDEICSEQLKIYNVEKDKNDSVARNFLDANKDLKNYLEMLDYKERVSNIEFYNKKQKEAKKTKKSYRTRIRKKLKKIYSHPQKYK